jgi:hypothetical protein
MLNSLIRYFDLQASYRPNGPKAQAAGANPSLPVIPQYIALVLGIAVQPFLAQFQQTRKWDLSGWQGWMIFSILVGLIVFPAVYKRSFDPQSNLFVQLCATFASGLGWQSLMQTGAAVIHH